MDDYIDSFFSSSSWVDEDVKGESCWGYRETDQPNMLFPSSYTINENDKGSFPLSSKLTPQDCSSLAPNIEPDVAFETCEEAQLDKKGDICADDFSPLMNGSLKVGNMSLQYDAALPAFDPLNLSYPKQIPGLDDLTPPLSFTEAGSVGGFCEQFDYNRSFSDLQNLSSMQQTWPSSSFRGVTPVSTAMGQVTTGQFGNQEGIFYDELNYILKGNFSTDQSVLEKLSASITTTEDKEDFRSYPASFEDAPNRTTSDGVPFQSQIPSAGGTGKARVRARRGQATDPHSIAERLRREKIAERMKNLQELVPNSTKVDKASMLDEIIEYVKFLQLQVKVLSMSRLGAAEAVIPLITNGQTEACNSLSRLPSTELGDNISASPDQIAFEQEVLKLMESNMKMAIQRLQSKGLCLMPIALATAIPSEKVTLLSNGFEDKKKIGFTDNGQVHTKSNSNSSSSSCSFSSNDPRQKSYDGINVAQQLSTKGTTVNGCNGYIKLENGKKDFPRN